MSKIKEDLTNKKFGRLTALERIDNNKWRCICDCGKERFVCTYLLQNGNTKSCGCTRRENATPLTNLLGKKIGKLTVLKFDKTINKYYKTRRFDVVYVHYWICECECGNLKSISHKSLIRKNFTKSCGCLASESTSKRSTKPNAGFNRVYAGYLNRCNTYNVEFKLSVDEFYNLTQQNCFYCNIEPLQIKPAWSKNVKPFIYNGVDRIDSNKGYLKDNSVACCSRCNYAKGDMNVEDYKLWVQRTYKHLFEKNNII